MPKIKYKKVAKREVPLLVISSALGRPVEAGGGRRGYINCHSLSVKSDGKGRSF